MTRRLTMLGLVLGLSAALAAPASADTIWNFGNAITSDGSNAVGTGTLGNTQAFSSNGGSDTNKILTLLGFACNSADTSCSAAPLYRNSTFVGMGVNSASDSTNLINNNPPEYIEVAFASTATWKPLKIVLNEFNGVNHSTDEWQIWGSSSDLQGTNLSGASLLAAGTGNTRTGGLLACNGTTVTTNCLTVAWESGDTGAVLDVTFTGAAAEKFLYIVPTTAASNSIDCSGNNFDNCPTFNLKEVIGQVDSVPEPSTLLLLGAGLVGLGGLVRRRQR